MMQSINRRNNYDKIEEHTGHYYIYERMKERIEELHSPELRY